MVDLPLVQTDLSVQFELVTHCACRAVLIPSANVGAGPFDLCFSDQWLLLASVAVTTMTARVAKATPPTSKTSAL